MINLNITRMDKFIWLNSKGKIIFDILDINNDKMTLLCKDGSKYQGTTFEGRLSVSCTGYGTYTWTNGAKYEGDFVNGIKTGKGIYTWVDRNKYEGDFVNGERTGKGIFIWANGDKYEGDFVNGERTGIGILTWTNGNIYEGDFVTDVRTGKGIFTWVNGDKYEGDFLNGKKTGIGKLYIADVNQHICYVSEGMFIDDIFQENHLDSIKYTRPLYYHPLFKLPEVII